MLCRVADPALALFCSKICANIELTLIASAQNIPFHIGIMGEPDTGYEQCLCMKLVLFISKTFFPPAHKLREVMEHGPGGPGHLAQEAGLLPKR